MALPVDEVQRELTPEEVLASLYAIQTKLKLPVTSWRVGGVARTINRAVSYVFAGFTRLIATGNKSAFYDTARGPWLDLRVADVAGPKVKRVKADFARGPCTVDNAKGGSYSYAARQFTAKASVSGKTYKNAAPFTVEPLQTGVSVDFEATEAGTASTAAPGQVDTIVTTALGLSITNPGPLIGTDAEDDDVFAAAGRESLGALSPNGPRDAYSYRAKRVKRPDGSTILVNRVQVSAAGKPVLVRVASPSGIVQPADVALIQAAIDADVVPNGVTAAVSSAVAHPVNIDGTLWVRSEINQSNAVIHGAALAKLTKAMGSTLMPIGGQSVPFLYGFVFRTWLIGQLEALELSGVENAAQYVIKADLATPAADEAIAANEVPTLGTLTIAVFQV